MKRSGIGLDGSREALIAQNTTHNGVIKTLDFNTTQTNLLASAGENGEASLGGIEYVD